MHHSRHIVEGLRGQHLTTFTCGQDVQGYLRFDYNYDRRIRRQAKRMMDKPEHRMYDQICRRAAIVG
jgi:hypothetical protein